MARHLSTISLGQPPPPQHGNVKWDQHWSQEGRPLLASLVSFDCTSDCYKSVFWSTSKKIKELHRHYSRVSHSTVNGTNSCNTCGRMAVILDVLYFTSLTLPVTASHYALSIFSWPFLQICWVAYRDSEKNEQTCTVILYKVGVILLDRCKISVC